MSEPEKRCPMCEHSLDLSDDGQWWECLCGFREARYPARELRQAGITMAEYYRAWGEA